MQQWTYHSDLTTLYSGNGMLFGDCYSGGNCGKNPEGLNNPAYESVHCVGPIPAGFYQVGEFFDQVPGKGPRVAHLISVEPDGNGGWTPIDPPYGRTGLMIHGDNSLLNHSASEGCLIAARFIRDAIQTGDIIHVVHQ